jgi:heptosyltransferase-2
MTELQNPSRATTKRLVHYDCRHFVGDRPCSFHKADGVLCADCPHYDPGSRRILIIKRGAIGDVLRTTSILPALKHKFAQCHLTWLTDPDAVDLLRNNRYIDSLMVNGPGALARLYSETYDLVIAPEAAKYTAALASMARADTKLGFGLETGGFVFAYNQGATEVFELGLFDDLKKDNQKTYEQLICQLAELPFERHKPILTLTPQENAQAARQLDTAGYDPHKPLIGINTGGGGRWPQKQWTLAGFSGLTRKLLKDGRYQVLLLGGPAEREFNQTILSTVEGHILDAGSDNRIRQFAALIAACDLVVTGDSLALHMALAARCRLVALFGPTSSTEIDLYERGRKVMGEVECLCCYLQHCPRHPTCMEVLDIETVYRAVAEELALIKPRN